jgi:hypothetical protein
LPKTYSYPPENQISSWRFCSATPNLRFFREILHPYPTIILSGADVMRQSWACNEFMISYFITFLTALLRTGIHSSKIVSYWHEVFPLNFVPTGQSSASPAISVLCSLLHRDRPLFELPGKITVCFWLEPIISTSWIPRLLHFYLLNPWHEISPPVFNKIFFYINIYEVVLHFIHDNNFSRIS